LSSIIILLGVSLILVNGSSNGQLPIAWSIIYDNTVTSITSDQQKAILVLGGEILLVILLATFANANQTAARFGIVLFVALWVVWTIRNPGPLSSITTAFGGTGSIAPSPSNSFSIPGSTFTIPNVHAFTLPTVPSSTTTTTKGKK
jgi:hypothetical protein